MLTLPTKNAPDLRWGELMHRFLTPLNGTARNEVGHFIYMAVKHTYMFSNMKDSQFSSYLVKTTHECLDA